jgi:hypothetical protein
MSVCVDILLRRLFRDSAGLLGDDGCEYSLLDVRSERLDRSGASRRIACQCSSFCLGRKPVSN